MDDEAEVEDDKAATIVRGASIFGGGSLLSNIFGFFVNFLLTQALGVAAYGMYIYASRIISIGSLFAGLGSKNSLLRYIPKHENEPHQRNQIFGLIIISSSIVSLLLSGALYVAAPIINSFTLEELLFVRILRILAIMLPFNTFVGIILNTFRGLGILEYREAISSFVQPGLRLIAVGISLLIGASTIGVMAALIIAVILTTMIALSLLFSMTAIRPALGIGRKKAYEYFSYSLPLTLSQAGSLLYNQIDIFMVGFFLSSAAVGIYGIATVLAGLLILPLTAINQLFPPIASGLYEREAYGELREIYQTTTRWAFTLTLFLTISIIIYRHEVLGIFGEEFVAGASVISLFAVGKMTNASVGPSGFVLIMTDHQYIDLGNQLAAGVLNTVLNYIFILQFGIIGAALGTVTTETILNLARIAEVWWFEGIHPYSWRFIKPTIAGIGAGASMYILGFVMKGIPLMILGGVAGGIVFFFLLFIFGLEKSDRLLLQRGFEKLSSNRSS